MTLIQGGVNFPDPVVTLIVKLQILIHYLFQIRCDTVHSQDVMKIGLILSLVRSENIFGETQDLET